MDLGYPRPELARPNAAAPTLSRNGRQIVLQAMALRGFVAESGDMSNAFLRESSGAVGSQNIFAEALPEVAEMFHDQWGPATCM